ncbi:DNA cytosine methyltransferase [Candidatus Dojkabacteria bacterium]|nr:DNA cytosine methyltransferase [Candidatus Dojkabacteria bacterium]
MKVLVACEFSGIVRDAFIARDFDAMSCDLLPTEKPGPHYQGDVMDIINDGWDLMIAHPPCTYLSYSANHVWNAPGRQEKREAARDFFFTLLNANIGKVCVENPVGWINTIGPKPTQIIHPYYYGKNYTIEHVIDSKWYPQLDEWYIFLKTPYELSTKIYKKPKVVIFDNPEFRQYWE